ASLFDTLLTVSDEAFLLLLFVNYNDRWKYTIIAQNKKVNKSRFVPWIVKCKFTNTWPTAKQFLDRRG
ncbi:MAG: hypothetical protein ACRC1D_02520, partial [Culicoidibacterales bacterium]